MDDFTPLTDPNHWLGWLGDDPASAVREQIESMLHKLKATATLEWVRLTGKPHFLTGGRKLPDDPKKIVVTRAALAVPFTLEVCDEGGTQWLRGVFSWVAVGLDGEKRRDRTYVDLDVESEWAEKQLVARIYELDAPEGSP